MSHHLTVGGRRTLYPGVVGGADADPGVETRPAANINVYVVPVEDRPVGRRPHRGAAQLQLLLRVPQLEGAGALVGGQLLAVGQGDGRGQVDDLLLQVGVGGLEAAQMLALLLCVGGGAADQPLLGALGPVHNQLCSLVAAAWGASLAVSAEEGQGGQPIVVQKADDHNHHHHHNHQDNYYLNKLQFRYIHALRLGSGAIAGANTIGLSVCGATRWRSVLHGAGE